jgi:hypothetical protein
VQACQRNVGEWSGPDLADVALRLLREGDMPVWSERRKQLSERHVYVFDSTILFVKPSTDKADPAR